MASHQEDSDIKIFGTPEPGSEDELLEQIKTLDIQRHNGNMEKARELGRNLYSIVIDDSTKEELKDPDFAEGKLAIKAGVLAMFTAEAAFNLYLPNPQLSTVAISELHRLLAELDSPVYEKILESPAYSFYFLALRRGDDVPEEIGKAFAEHCRHEDDPKYIAEGRYIYERVLSVVKKEIDKMDFAE